jgi:hypothetical protein
MDSIERSTAQARTDSVDLTVDLSELTHEQLQEEEARIIEELAITEEPTTSRSTSAAPRGRRMRSCCAIRPDSVA